MRFGLFDWLDESGRGQGETYEERLRMLELADLFARDVMPALAGSVAVPA